MYCKCFISSYLCSFFNFSYNVFWRGKILVLIKFSLSTFSIMVHVFCILSRKSLLTSSHKDLILWFFLEFCSFSFYIYDPFWVKFYVECKVGFPGIPSGKEHACWCRWHKRHGFSPWVGRIPWRRAWYPTSIFLSGDSHRQRGLSGHSP